MGSLSTALYFAFLRRTLAGACLVTASVLNLAEAQPEAVVSVQLLDNGNFAERIEPGAAGSKLIPWWRADLGAQQVIEDEGVFWLGTQGDVRARQPMAAYAPLAGGVKISGRVRGLGALRVIDGLGREVLVSIDGSSDEVSAQGREFEFSLAELAQAREALSGRGIEVSGAVAAFVAPMPRLMLELGSASKEQAAYWTDLEAWVPLPCPSEDELRVEVISILSEIFATWRERVIDPETGFACHIHDIVTGERLVSRDGMLNPAHTVILQAVTAHDDPQWRAMLELFLESWFTLCFQPETGLPRNWDLVNGVGRGERPMEIHQVLDFLYDLADHGPERWRDEANQRLLRIAEHVLAKGAMPDGQVAAGYFAATGAPALGYSHLRRFDVPAPLAKLGARDGDTRYRDLAREAVGEFEYTWLWPGTWDAIDPGFDDDYGHYGDRALVMSQAWPEEPSFRRVVRGGYDVYAPLWRDALRLGGNIAADQIRGWRIFAGLAELEPELLPETEALLRAAQRVHFKGEQYQNGAWGDVTVFGFDPKAGLQVGDLPGMPQNLLQGLASNYSTQLSLRNDETRAMFTAVMRSSREHYARPYGYLVTRAERKGANSAGGSFRFAAPLADMLTQLSR